VDVTSQPQRGAALAFLAPAWFSLVMGLSGLALAWLSAQPQLGEGATAVALVLGVLASALFAVLALATLWRWQRFPKALAEDLAHPVRHAFVATVPVGLLLLASVGLTLGVPQGLLQPLWWTGSLLQLWVTWWVMSRWLGPSPAAAGGLWPAITPVLLIAVVGNVVAPLAGVGLGHAAWSAAQLGIGVLFWPLVLGLTLVRRFAHGPLPERLLPTWFIAVAPPSVIGLSLLTLGAPTALVLGCWGVAAFTAVWVASQARRMLAQPFALTFWALSFPLAALTNLTLKLGQQTGLTGWSQAGLLLLALTSLVISGLVLGTVRGLRQGTLLAPEPVAAIVPAGAP
jgi:tellurite resistance protein